MVTKSIWALAALWGVPANTDYITKKKKNRCSWELFKTSMINVVDILTACKQGKCLNSKFTKLSCFLSLRVSNDSSVPSLPAGFCLTRPLAIPVQGAFVLKSPARASGHLPTLGGIPGEQIAHGGAGQPGDNLIQSSTQTWPTESGCTNEMPWFSNFRLELWYHPVDGRNRYKRGKCRVMISGFLS